LWDKFLLESTVFLLIVALENLIDISIHESFISADRSVKWSHFRLNNSAFAYEENPARIICCELLKAEEGSCPGCPINKAFQYQAYCESELVGSDNRKWLVSAYPVCDQKGTFCGVIVKGKNTNQNAGPELIADSLIESERRLSTLISNLPGLVYRCKNDPDWTMEIVSEGCFALTGYEPDDLIGNKKLSFNDLIAPNHKADVWNDWQAAIAEKRPYTGEYQIISADGSWKWVWEQGQAVYSTDGKVIALEGFIQDITDRKQVEIALINSEEKYRNLVESALVGVYSTQLNGDLIIANEALSRMLEYDSIEEFLSVKNVIALYKNPADRERMLELITESKKLTDFELTWITKNNKEITVVISSLLNDDIISGMVMDITHRKQSEELLREEKERAELSDKLKASFLANISHEIRTPLNGILGFADILLEQDIPKNEKEHYSNVIHNLSGQLLSIVNDILEISKIETNQIKLSYSQVNINQILNKLYTNFKEIAGRKNLAMELNSELSENQATVYGDDLRLVQVLTHLLNNAVKFTYSGSISFGCSLRDDMLHFFVRDTGIGILPENRGVIFERFRQAEDSLTRKFGGSGLGLSISKALIEMMGGEIYVDSETGAGSTFYFTIPYKIVPKNQKIQRNPLETKSCLRETKILICEDDDFGFLYINRVLTQAGASTCRALSGNKAIKICQSDEELDLIIMDLRMPEMSGNDAAEYIKKLRPAIPIIACTASSADEVQHQLNKSEFDGVVFKPIISSVLLETICKLL